MKPIQLLIPVVFLMVLSCQTKNSDITSGETHDEIVADWYDYIPVDSTYCVKFPGKPSVNINFKNDEFGITNIKTQSFGGGSYLMSCVCADMPWDYSTEAEQTLMLGTALSGALDLLSKAKVNKMEKIDFAGCPGIELEAEGYIGANQRVTLVGKYIIDGKRIYQIYAITEKECRDLNKVDNFIQSFKMIN